MWKRATIRLQDKPCVEPYDIHNLRLNDNLSQLFTIHRLQSTTSDKTWSKLKEKPRRFKNKPQSIQYCSTLLYISPFYNVKNDFYNVKMKRSSNMKKNNMLFFGHNWGNASRDEIGDFLG